MVSFYQSTGVQSDASDSGASTAPCEPGDKDQMPEYSGEASRRKEGGGVFTSTGKRHCGNLSVSCTLRPPAFTIGQAVKSRSILPSIQEEKTAQPTHPPTSPSVTRLTRRTASRTLIGLCPRL